MADDEVLQLHNSGICTAAIAIRTGLDLNYVRSVVSREVVRRSVERDPKAHHNAVKASRRQLSAQRRAKAEAKRDKALAAIAVLQAQIAKYDR